MRLVRSMLIGAALVGMVVVLSGVSFAEGNAIKINWYTSEFGSDRINFNRS